MFEEEQEAVCLGCEQKRRKSRRVFRECVVEDKCQSQRLLESLTKREAGGQGQWLEGESLHMQLGHLMCPQEKEN